MKGRIRFFIGLLLGVIIGALVAVGVYFLTVGDVAWQEYVQNDLVPNIVIALTSISAITIAASPIIKKVMVALNNFNTATKDVNDTVTNNSRTEQRVADCEERLTAFDNRLDRIETAADNTEKIVRIGFCNTDELVKKGYAKEIAKVGKDEVEEKSEN